MSARASFILVFLTLLFASTAEAKPVYVSARGDDTKPCTRGAPCRTFATAILKAPTSGEIRCLDSGEFGPINITRSINIDCAGKLATITGTGSYGIQINAAASSVVILRGLTISGSGGATTGISILTASAVLIDKVVVQRFASGNGVNFASTVACKLTVTDSQFIHNSGGAGIQIRTTTGNSGVVLSRVTAANNASGIVVDGAAGGNAQVSIRDCLASNNTNYGVSSSSTSGTLTVLIDRSDFSMNSTGVYSTGTSSSIRIGNSTIAGNTNGVSYASSGTLLSFESNLIYGNTTGGTFSGLTPGTM